MTTPEKILKEAISLKPLDQAKLIDNLISILDKPDPALARRADKHSVIRRKGSTKPNRNTPGNTPNLIKPRKNPTKTANESRMTMSDS